MKLINLGLCKAQTYDKVIKIGYLGNLFNNYFIYNQTIGLNDPIIFNIINPDTVCAASPFIDKDNNRVFEFDVLSIPNSDKLIYVYFDEINGTWLYRTNYDSSKEEPLNINELLAVGNILFDSEKFGDNFYD